MTFDFKRRKTRTIKIGDVKIGSAYPVAIQSMVKSSAKDVKGCIRQINELQGLGCQIARIAVEDRRDALLLSAIKRGTRLPIVADIHFDYRLGLAAIEAGADKIRLNPGNIYKPREVREVIAAARAAHIPVRIGANSGSLRKRVRSPVKALVRSITDYLDFFKKARFHDLVISVKGSNIRDTVEAYEDIAKVCDYPLHLGVTATGLPLDGVVKSSIGIGVLLFKGIGDTIRVSLLGDPGQEVLVGRVLLNSLGLRMFGPEWICCPTCGRCEVDLLKKAENFRKKIKRLSKSEQSLLDGYKIALMGCIVNGPGEAKEADLGIAFSKHKGLLFKKGEPLRSVSLSRAEIELFGVLKQLLKEDER